MWNSGATVKLLFKYLKIEKAKETTGVQLLVVDNSAYAAKSFHNLSKSYFYVNRLFFIKHIIKSTMFFIVTTPMFRYLLWGRESIGTVMF